MGHHIVPVIQSTSILIQGCSALLKPTPTQDMLEQETEDVRGAEVVELFCHPKGKMLTTKRPCIRRTRVLPGAIPLAKTLTISNFSMRNGWNIQETHEMTY